MSVSLHESPTPCDFRIGVEGVDNYRNVREIQVEPFTSQLVEINTGFMAPGAYKLTAEGLRGVEFQDNAYLTFLPKNTSILVQSDKAIYKPGDLVRFRVLVLDLNMKPQISSGDVRIFITVCLNHILFLRRPNPMSKVYLNIHRMIQRIASNNGWMLVRFVAYTAMNLNCHRVPFSATGISQ